MTARLDFAAASPEAYKALLALTTSIKRFGIEPKLLHLIHLRASQLNGCAYCVDMHVREALHDGETQQRLHLLVSWRESSLYSETERAVLAWTEALTLLPQTQAPDADYERLKSFYSDADMVKLTTAIAQINTWNRLCVGFRSQHPVEKAA